MLPSPYIRNLVAALVVQPQIVAKLMYYSICEKSGGGRKDDATVGLYVETEYDMFIVHILPTGVEEMGKSWQSQIILAK